MSTDFRRSLRTLDADSPRRNTILLVTAAALLLAWGCWFTLSRVSIYAATGHARLEVDREKHPVAVPVAGQIVSVDLAVGRYVRAGEPLVELDATAEHLSRTREEVRLAPAQSQIDLLRVELGAEERALQEERQGAQAGIAESEARAQQGRAAARFAREEADRLARLHKNGLVSELEALRADNNAAERAGEAEAAAFASTRLVRDFEVREQNRLAQIARLKREIASIEGERAEARAASDRIGFDIEQRIVRAPISGTIAEVAPLKPGGLVGPGDRVCTIVPDGEVRVVALFPPSVALGRVRPGQVARVRLAAFPWTQYGSASARVTTVAGELQDGQIRVELSLERDEVSSLPFQHGLPAEVNVEVDRASPATLVLRSIGAYTSVAAMQR
jgi:membrane fusion protein (multidrug efflux system)